MSEKELPDNKKTKTPTVIKSNTYEFTIEHLSNGKRKMIRKNNGFNAFELLGITSLIQLEVKEMMAGGIKPDFIELQLKTKK